MKSIKWTLCFIATLMNNFSYAITPTKTPLPIALKALSQFEGLTFQQRAIANRAVDIRSNENNRLREIHNAYQAGEIVNANFSLVEVSMALMVVVSLIVGNISSKKTNKRIPTATEFDISSSSGTRIFNQQLKQALKEQAHKLKILLAENETNITGANHQFFDALTNRYTNQIWDKSTINDAGTPFSNPANAVSDARNSMNTTDTTIIEPPDAQSSSRTTPSRGRLGAFSGNGNGPIELVNIIHTELNSTNWSLANRKKLVQQLNRLTQVSGLAGYQATAYINNLGKQLAKIGAAIDDRDKMEHARLIDTQSSNITSATTDERTTINKIFSTSRAQNIKSVTTFENQIANSAVDDIASMTKQLNHANNLKRLLKRLATGLRVNVNLR